MAQPWRCERLRSAADFHRVRANGQTWTTSVLVVQAVTNQEGKVRVGIVVSKRLGKAVRRNRIKRLVREAVRQVCPEIRRGWDLVIVARSGISDAPLTRVRAALLDVLGRAGLLDGSLSGPPVATESPTGGPPFPFGTRS